MKPKKHNLSVQNIYQVWLLFDVGGFSNLWLGPVSSERLTSRIQAAYDPDDYISLLPPSPSTSVLARESKGFRGESVEQGESLEDDYYYPGLMTRKRYIDVETDYSD